MKAERPYLLFSNWGEHPNPNPPPPSEYEDDAWDAIPPKKCYHEKDDCSVIGMVTYKPPTCKKITGNSVNKRIEKSKLLILKKLNKIIKMYGGSYLKLDNWTNFKSFLENNFNKNEILNSSQFSYLYKSYNELLKKRKAVERIKKNRREMLKKMAQPKMASLLNSFASSFGGGGVKKKIKSYYKKYLKNPVDFIKNIVEKIIQEEDDIIRLESQGFQNLTDIYVYKKIPLFEYHGWDINNPESSYDKELDGDFTEHWRLEWDGMYDPDKTEFQLFSLIEKKYLINESEEIIKNDKMEKYVINKLSWRDKQKWGNGWKIQPSKAGAGTPVESADAIQEKNETYKNAMSKIIYTELYNKFEKDIQKEIKISDDTTKQLEEDFKNTFNKQIEDIRKEDIVSLNKNAWLFSPNIGKHGEFLISNPLHGKSQWMDFGGLDFKKYKFQFMIWGDEGPIYEKHFDQENNQIAISRKNKSGGLEFLKNTLEDTTNSLQWVGEDKWGQGVKWILEWDKKLEINLNSIKAPEPVNGEMDILSRYKLVENKKITITVGNKIKQISNKFNWENEFMAIKKAEQVGYYGCIDYAWIAEEDGKIVYYDDDYSIYNGEKNTLTRCWFVMDKEKSITETYLAVNKLEYELNFARWFSYKKCFRRKHMGYGRYACTDMRIVTWSSMGTSLGMNSWRGRLVFSIPLLIWAKRQNTMLSETSLSKNNCLTKINKPMTVYLKSPGNGYLKSDSFGKPIFSKNIKKPNITGWNLLMKYKTGKIPKWLKTQRGLIKNYKNYYTKIFESKKCKGASELLKIPEKLKFSSSFTINNCAEMFRKWQLTKGEKYRWFTFLPKDKNFKENECYALKIEDQCKGFQDTLPLAKYQTFSMSTGRYFGGLGWNGRTRSITVPVRQFITYKLDDAFDSI